MPATPSSSGLRTAIIVQTKKFLVGLKAGFSDEKLNSILLDIKEMEFQLIRLEGKMLDPEMWKLLHSRFAKREGKNTRNPAG